MYNRCTGSVRVYGEVCVWKETSIYIGVPLTGSGCTSVFSIPSASSFSSLVYWGKKVYSCLLLASNFLFPRGRISLFAPLEMKISPVEIKNVV